jgi:hypothetical protein
MVISCTLCAELLVVLFSIKSQEVFKLVVTNSFTGAEAMNRILAHSVRDL